MNRIVCFFKGHEYQCIRTIVLNEDGTGDIEHVHFCLRCDSVKKLPTEQMDSEILGILKAADVKTDFEPPKTYIH